MNNKTFFIGAIVLLVVALITIPFWRSQKTTVKLDFSPGTLHKVTVKEIVQTSNYTYFKVDEEGSEYWIAGNKREAREGEVLYFADALKMEKFASRELQRTFDSIYFIQNISDLPPGENKDANMAEMQGRAKEPPAKEDIRIEKAKDGITIAELLQNHARYAGKTVKVRGMVTKFNSMIMNRNWVHIQDGTEFSGNFDLAVTTNEMIKPGSIATFTGKVSINKDFGAGYFYNVILEDATVSDLMAVSGSL